MKTINASTRKFNGLLRKIPPATPPEPFLGGDLIGLVIQSFMMWEATSSRAATACRNMIERVVDINELRICLPDETVEFIGATYPMAHERCERMRATLRDIFQREHKVSLDSLRSQNKKEVRTYIETLEGITPYVTARVLLLGFEAHAIPVDQKLLGKLVSASVIGPEIELAEASNWLARQIKAGDASGVHHRLQAWTDKGGASRAAHRRTTRASTRKSSGGPRSAASSKTTRASGRRTSSTVN